MKGKKGRKEGKRVKVTEPKRGEVYFVVMNQEQKSET